MLSLMLTAYLSASAHDCEVDGIYYNIFSEGDKTVAVTYKGSNADSRAYKGDIVIPSTIDYNGNTYTVKSIGYKAFLNCTGITEVIIPNSVTDIQGCAFDGCTGLTEIVIPNSITDIKGNAFDGCTGLKDVTIGESVTTIGSNAFNNTPFYNNLPDGVVYLGKVLYAYKGTMPANTTIEVADGIKSITSLAFLNCSNLIGIIFPDSMEYISYYAFAYCYRLTEVSIPNSVNFIASNAFMGTPFEDNLPDGVVYLGKVLFKYKGTMPENTSIDIVDGTKSISDYAFDGCSGLISVSIPSSVMTINDCAFLGCTALASVTSYALVPQYFYYEEQSIFDDKVFDTCVLYVLPSAIDAYKSANVWARFANIQAIQGVFVETISLNAESMDLTVGETFQLSANVQPADAENTTVTYSSSNHDVVTVSSSGLVTAVAEGDAEIIVRSADGNAETRCTVHVNPQSGINEIIANDGAIEVYNLSGVKIGDSLDGLPGGIYVVRCGGKTWKVRI